MQLRPFPLLLLLSLLSLASAALCGNQTGLLPNPSDPSLRGPYPVSSKLLPGTFTSRNLTVEVFFPYVDAWACVCLLRSTALRKYMMHGGSFARRSS